MVILIPNDRSFEEFNQSLGEKNYMKNLKNYLTIGTFFTL